MSGQHMHVHGAHEHEVEHRAYRGPGLAQQVAIFAAILSTIGAVVACLGAATQNEAMLTLIQIAIALGSITALTRKRWLFTTAIVAAAGGISLFGNPLAP